MISRVLFILALAIASQQAHGYAITSYLEMVIVSSVGGSWKTVPLSNSYTDPVIACTYNLSSVAENDAAVRVQQVGAGFQIKVQHPINSTDVTPGDVHCTISESGAYTHPIKYEAHTVSSDETNYRSDWTVARMENVSAAPYKLQSYTQPVVTGQVMSYNNDDFSSFWANNCVTRLAHPTDTGICVGKHTGKIIPNHPNPVLY